MRETLESAIAEAVEQDSYQEIITGSGNLVVYRDSAEFTQFAEDEAERFADLIGN